MNEHMTSPSARPFSVWLYRLIVFGRSWPFQIASVIWSNGNVLSEYVLNSTAIIMVAVGTYLAGCYVLREGFAGAGWSWGKPRYYLAVIGLASAMWVVPIGLDLVLGERSLSLALTAKEKTVEYLT